MSKMIKLDWLAMKFYQLRILFILPPYVIGVGMFMPEWIIPLIGFIMVSYSVNPFAVEDKGQLNNLYLTLPVSRKKIVRARFGLSLIMQLAGIAIGALATVIMSNLLYGKTMLGFYHSFESNFQNIFVLICGTLLFYSVMTLSTFPILFKLGYAKGKVFGFYIPVFAIGILVYAGVVIAYINEEFVERAIALTEWAAANPVITGSVLLSAACLITLLAYALSCKAYLKREF